MANCANEQLARVIVAAWKLGLERLDTSVDDYDPDYALMDSWEAARDAADPEVKAMMKRIEEVLDDPPDYFSPKFHEILSAAGLDEEDIVDHSFMNERVLTWFMDNMDRPDLRRDVYDFFTGTVVSVPEDAHRK